MSSGGVCVRELKLEVETLEVRSHVGVQEHLPPRRGQWQGGAQAAEFDRFGYTFPPPPRRLDFETKWNF